MSLRKEVSYCSRLRTVFPASEKALVVLVRGITLRFKMLVFYDFDIKMDDILLMKMISEVENAGAHVSAVVLDMGNHGILKDLNIYNGETKVFSFNSHSYYNYIF